MSESIPKVAIVTRTKNRPYLLKRALESVVAQTSKDYIHVVLNDGGDKGEVEEVLSELPDSNRIVIHNTESVGLTPALNQAIRHVDSDYIAILDDDDSWHPDRVKRVNEYLSLHPDEQGVAVVMDRIIEDVSDDGTVVEKSRNRWHEGVVEVSLYDQMLDNYLTNNCITYRREFYEELGGYDETLEVGEDWDFGIRYLTRCDISFIPEVLAYYHHRPETTGDLGNSVFAGADKHRRSLVRLRNRYLRQDIEGGKLGVGFIMNHLADTREQQGRLEDYVGGMTVRLEGHINRAESFIEKLIYETQGSALYRAIKARLRHR